MKKRLLFSIIAAVALTALIAAPVPAQDNPQPELKLENVKVSAYQELVRADLSKRYGVRETLGADGRVLVAVNVTVMPQWTDQIQDARVEDSDIKLETDQGSVLMSGYYRDYGEFEIGSYGFSAWRRSDWKEKPQGQPFTPVFSVPAGLKTAKFVLGKVSADIQIPAPGPAPDPSGDLKVQVVGAQFLDYLRSEESVGDLKPKPATEITGGGQGLLQLTVRFTPTKANNQEGDQYYFTTETLGLLLDGGLYVPCLGQISWDQLNQRAGIWIKKESGDQFKTEETTLYFAVPPGGGAYKMTYQSVAVAEGQMPGGGAPKATEEPKAGDKPTDKNKGKTTIKNLMDNLKKN